MGRISSVPIKFADSPDVWKKGPRPTYNGHRRTCTPQNHLADFFAAFINSYMFVGMRHSLALLHHKTAFDRGLSISAHAHLIDSGKHGMAMEKFTLLIFVYIINPILTGKYLHNIKSVSIIFCDGSIYFLPINKVNGVYLTIYGDCEWRWRLVLAAILGDFLLSLWLKECQLYFYKWHNF